MKLLKDEVIDKEDGDVVLQLSPVTMSQQARIMVLARVADVEKRVELSFYALNHIVQRVSICGVPYDPIELAKRADLSDKDTVSAIIKIGALVVAAAFPSESQKKK